MISKIEYIAPDLSPENIHESVVCTPTAQNLITLKLLTQYQGPLVPTKGAVLLFGKCREQYFSDAWVQCGRFIGADKANIFDHIDIHENLPETLNSVMLFLNF